MPPIPPFEREPFQQPLKIQLPIRWNFGSGEFVLRQKMVNKISET